MQFVEAGSKRVAPLRAHRVQFLHELNYFELGVKYVASILFDQDSVMRLRVDGGFATEVKVAK